MSESLKRPWIHQYFVDIAESYGSSLQDVPIHDKKRRIQFAECLTFPQHVHDTFWIRISDKSYHVPVLLTQEAIDAYNKEHNVENESNNLRLTNRKQAIAFIGKFRPIFVKVPMGGKSGMDQLERFALEASLINIIGGDHEGVFGSPRSLEQDEDLRLWAQKLRVGEGGDFLKLAKEERDRDNADSLIVESVPNPVDTKQNTRSPSKENVKSSPVLRIPKRTRQSKEVVPELVDFLKAWKKKWDPHVAHPEEYWKTNETRTALLDILKFGQDKRQKGSNERYAGSPRTPSPVPVHNYQSRFSRDPLDLRSEPSQTQALPKRQSTPSEWEDSDAEKEKPEVLSDSRQDEGQGSDDDSAMVDVESVLDNNPQDDPTDEQANLEHSEPIAVDESLPDSQSLKLLQGIQKPGDSPPMPTESQVSEGLSNEISSHRAAIILVPDSDTSGALLSQSQSQSQTAQSKHMFLSQHQSQKDPPIVHPLSQQPNMDSQSHFQLQPVQAQSEVANQSASQSQPNSSHTEPESRPNSFNINSQPLPGPPPQPSLDLQPESRSAPSAKESSQTEPSQPVPQLSPVLANGPSPTTKVDFKKRRVAKKYPKTLKGQHVPNSSPPMSEADDESSDPDSGSASPAQSRSSKSHARGPSPVKQDNHPKEEIVPASLPNSTTGDKVFSLSEPQEDTHEDVSFPSQPFGAQQVNIDADDLRTHALLESSLKPSASSKRYAPTIALVDASPSLVDILSSPSTHVQTSPVVKQIETNALRGKSLPNYLETSGLDSALHGPPIYTVSQSSPIFGNQLAKKRVRSDDPQPSKRMKFNADTSKVTASSSSGGGLPNPHSLKVEEQIKDDVASDTILLEVLPVRRKLNGFAVSFDLRRNETGLPLLNWKDISRILEDVSTRRSAKLEHESLLTRTNRE